MKNQQPARSIDPRAFYWTYAIVAWTSAAVLLTRLGTYWFGTDLPNRPWGMAVIVRLFAACIAAGGCFAASLGAMEDPLTRRRARRWFLAANVIVFAMFIMQQQAVLGGGMPQYAGEILFVVVVLGVLSGVEEAPGVPVDWAQATTLFGRTPAPSTRRLRSRYEQQIREAAKQEERNRLARELHDSIKQQLFVVQTSAATVQARWEADPGGAKGALEQVRNSAHDAMTEMEVMLDQLKATPLENVGLVEALKKQCEALGLRTGVAVSFEPGVLPHANRMAPGAAQAIFRVAQEALANVARHARPRSVRVALEGNGALVRLVIEDDGAGFDPKRATHGFGLSNMRERAEEFDGELLVRAEPGRGTTITLTIPCLPERPASAGYEVQALLFGGMLIVGLVLGAHDPTLLIVAFIPAAGLARALTRLRHRGRAKEAL